jgi:hypothetical protein
MTLPEQMEECFEAVRVLAVDVWPHQACVATAVAFWNAVDFLQGSSDTLGTLRRPPFE